MRCNVRRQRLSCPTVNLKHGRSERGAVIGPAGNCSGQLYAHTHKNSGFTDGVKSDGTSKESFKLPLMLRRSMS